ncbi:MAG: M28 family peptidase [Alphaproteobacteria bacterium]|nr:M28 family peptidase [Alphaproteobacteria bacterium]
MLVTLYCCILIRPTAKFSPASVPSLPGQERKHEILVIGAHYDTHKDSPGANDNGSAVAALFELARSFARCQTDRTLRFVAFTNEETPFTRRKAMGSRVYASECRHAAPLSLLSHTRRHPGQGRFRVVE